MWMAYNGELVIIIGWEWKRALDSGGFNRLHLHNHTNLSGCTSTKMAEMPKRVRACLSELYEY